ncbi:hypothetical protein QQ045_029159 [Rhodiola kirilowii]
MRANFAASSTDCPRVDERKELTSVVGGTGGRSFAASSAPVDFAGNMNMFEEMNFCGNLDFFSAHPAELLVSHEVEPEATVEEDYTDDEMDVDELERRMWRDRMLLRKLKEQIKAMKHSRAVIHGVLGTLAAEVPTFQSIMSLHQR